MALVKSCGRSSNPHPDQWRQVSISKSGQGRGGWLIRFKGEICWKALRIFGRIKIEWCVGTALSQIRDRMSQNNFFNPDTGFFLKIFFYFLFLEGGREGEREENISVWLPIACLLVGNLARNPGMCPDWESNLWPFGLQACTQSTESHQPGPFIHTHTQVFISC